MNMPTLIATTSSNTGTLGRLVCWDQNGYVNTDDYVQALLSVGIPKELLPGPTDPKDACERAIADVVPKKRGRGGGKISISKMGTTMDGKKGETIWIIHNKEKNTSEETIAFCETLKVRLTQIGTVYCEPIDHPVAATFAARFEYHLDHLDTNDVSAVNTSVVRACKGTRTRQRGGLYFIDASNLALWDSLVEATEKVSSHVFHAIPADNIDCLRKVILSGFVSQVESEIVLIETAMDKNLRKKGLVTQVRKCAAVERQMEHYKDLLGVTLEDLTEKMDELKANVSMLALAASATDDEDA